MLSCRAVHESSLARQLLRTVIERASASGAKRVMCIRGWVAETEALAPGAIEFHFAALAPGTAAEGARLELEVTHVRARCKGCGEVYLPEHHLTLCPSCGGVEAQLLGPTGVGLDALEVE